MARPADCVAPLLGIAGAFLLTCGGPTVGMAQAPASATPVIEDQPRPREPGFAPSIALPPARGDSPQSTVGGHRLDRLAAEQRVASQSAFRRGLLPLADFLEHVTAAYEAELSEAAARVPSDDDAPPSLRDQPVPPDEERRRVTRRALAARAEVLRVAARDLEAFRQPAAQGWSADVALAKYALADAEMALARLDGRLRDGVVATQPLERAAREHYLQSLFDHRVLGHGSVPQLVEAVALLNLSPKVTQAAATEGVAITEAFARRGAGLGREDFVEAAQLQRARLDTARPDAADPSRTLAAFHEADRFAERLFARQRDFYRYGTASLMDLGRTWRTRLVLHQQADEAHVPLDGAAAESRSVQLRELSQLAGQVQDPRGRMASDLLYVELLKQSSGESQPMLRTARKPSPGGY